MAGGSLQTPVTFTTSWTNIIGSGIQYQPYTAVKFVRWGGRAYALEGNWELRLLFNGVQVWMSTVVDGLTVHYLSSSDHFPAINYVQPVLNAGQYTIDVQARMVGAALTGKIINRDLEFYNGLV